MKRRLRAVIVAVLVLGPLPSTWALTADAQLPPLPQPLEDPLPQVLPPSTTTPAPPPSTAPPAPPPTQPPAPPPTNPPQAPSPQAPPTTSPAPVSPGSPVTGPAGSPVAPDPSSPLAPAPDAGPVVAPAPPLPTVHSNYIPTGSNNSSAVLEALRGLENLGFTPEEALRTGMGHFPVAGYATYSDDWHAPRGTPEAPRLHMGTDVFAAYGTPVRAPFDGVVTHSDGGLGGKAVTLTTRDGTYYYMAHLAAFAPDVPNGSSVKQGDIVGLNGDSGNAVGGSPHVHFEIHPGGGAAVNPKPILDGWLAEALAGAESLVASFRSQTVESGGSLSSMVQAMGRVRRFDGRPFAGGSQPQMASLLWASSVSPTGSAVRLAEVEAARAAEAIDWDLLASEAQAKATLRRNVLAPLTPPGFAQILGSRGF
ncbi:MAG: M23 family metallopeptidase [Actinomycetota bacterium]|nr:M23 family metallopeptidase [Actinomycetota bacterium]